MMHMLQSTTLTCLLEGPMFTGTLSEFLLHVQGGLPQGSLKSGVLAPKGSVPLSTSFSECERCLALFNSVIFSISFTIAHVK